MRVKNVSQEVLEQNLHLLKNDILLLNRSKYFDSAWYLDHNPDIRDLGLNPLLHYLKVGWAEWRDPSKDFNTFLYLDAYEDVKKALINPLVHYERFGKQEGRRIPLPKFIDNTQYIYYFSIVAIVKNEAPYMKEWLDYHISMGVEHFYIYNNESEDNLEEVLAPYIEKKCITYATWSGRMQQVAVYHDCLVKYGHQSRWLGVIDIDEFICPCNTSSISEILKDYEGYNGLAINWLRFDSNGHNKKPQGSVLRNYTRTHYDLENIEAVIKSIVDPSKVVKLLIHRHYYQNGSTLVTADYKEVWNYKSPYHVIDKIRINHYYSKSKEEYLQKIARGTAWIIETKKVEESSYNFPRTTYDCTIWKHIKKKSLGMRLEYLKYQFLKTLHKYRKPALNKIF